MLLLGCCALMIYFSSGCHLPHTPAHILDFPDDRVAIPIRYLYDRPVIDVIINDQGPFALLLDTGATSVSLESSVIEQLQLPEIGTATTKNVLVLDHKLDTATATKHSPWSSISLNGGCPEVSIEFDGESHPFLVDTGSQGGLTVSKETAHSLPRHPTQYNELSAVAGGMFWSNSTRLTANALLGSHVLEKPYITCYEKHPGRNLIGMDVLRHFVIEIDLAGKRIRFSQQNPSSLSFPDKKRLGIQVA